MKDDEIHESKTDCFVGNIITSSLMVHISNSWTSDQIDTHGENGQEILNILEIVTAVLCQTFRLTAHLTLTQ